MARDCRQKTGDLQNNQTSGWSGTDDKTKGKPCQGKGKQDKGKIEGKPGKSKGKGPQHGKKGKKGFLEIKVREDTQETRKGQEHTEWTDTCWDHADNWTDADWWSRDWSTDLWTDPAWEQAARQLPPTQQAQEQSNPTHGGSISMSAGLTMCDLSDDDEEQRSEQNEVNT